MAANANIFFFQQRIFKADTVAQWQSKYFRSGFGETEWADTEYL